jgi:predicted O-methyltransferase YrrM
MEERIERLLHEYEMRNEAEWQLQKRMTPNERAPRRDEFLLSVGRSTGMLLNLLIKESKSRSILELGTSYGYSTIWLAEAAQETGGTVLSLELHPYKLEHAHRKLNEVGLASIVKFQQGDARETLKLLAGPFDFVLMDLWKDMYVACLDLLLPKLCTGALVVADNMLRPEAARQDAEAYRRRVRSTERFESVLLPVGSGIELSRYLQPAS